MTHPHEAETAGDELDPKVLVEKLVAWLRQRGEPNSGIDYQSADPYSNGYASVKLVGSDATFIAAHFHGRGARELADALSPPDPELLAWRVAAQREPVAWQGERFSDSPSPRWHWTLFETDPRRTLGSTLVRNVSPLYTSPSAPETREAVIEALRSLMSAYVSLLETGYRRIIDAGGTCDPVSVMERSDPALTAARAALHREMTVIEEFSVMLPVSGVEADMAGMPAEWLERAVREVGRKIGSSDALRMASPAQMTTATAELIARAKTYLAKQPPVEHRTFSPEHPEVLICELLAALERTPPGDAGEGWKSVPLRPDDRMIRAGVVERDRAGSGGSVVSIYAAMLAASLIPPSSPRTGVTVKALKWGADGRAYSVLGMHLVSIWNTDRGSWRWKSPSGSWAFGRKELTEDEAKAAAQADYEARILAALTLPEAGGSDAWRPIDKNTPKRDVIVAQPIQTADGQPAWLVGEASWFEHDGDDDEGWWWANTTPGDYYADKLMPEPTFYRPLPNPPEERA